MKAKKEDEMRQILAVVFALAIIVIACNRTNPPASSSQSPAGPSTAVADRIITVKTKIANRLNNAVESDARLLITAAGKTIDVFDGSATDHVIHVTASGTDSYDIHAMSWPGDYAVSGCTGKLAADIQCTITLTDTLAPPQCDPQILKGLYRPTRFEGMDNNATPTPKCETTWGVVHGSEPEHDADIERWIQLTKTEFTRLFSAPHGNFNSDRGGLLVAEWIFRGTVDDTGRAQGASSSYETAYHNFVSATSFDEQPLPIDGDSGVFVGFMVFDCGHGCWTELHPMIWWHKLLHPLAAEGLGPFTPQAIKKTLDDDRN